MPGKVAWVIGGSGGIGSAVCKGLAREGIDVAICYFRGKTEAEEVADECRQLGARALSFALDVTNSAMISEVYQQIRFSLGTPDLLIYSAGVTHAGLIQDVTPEVYDLVMDTNVRGAFACIQTALPAMLRNSWGRIVLLSSIWGETGGAGEVLYSAAKGAINGLTRALGKELARSGITVNAVAPGAIDTKMLQEQLSAEEQALLAEEIPMGRLGDPHEVASLIRYLCSEEAGYITGQVLHVNGGWYC